MLYVLRKLVGGLLHQLHSKGWVIILMILLLLYAGGYTAMWYFEKPGPILDHYSWWFVVTVATVGYGDITPLTTGGRYAGMIIMIFGIGTIGLIIGKVAEVIVERSALGRKGLGELHVSNHTVIMGYRPDTTKKLVAELASGVCGKNDIVLCSNSLEENPFINGEVIFVRGELSGNDVLHRACVSQAARVIVQGADDNQTFLTAFAVRQVNTVAPLVVHLNNEEHEGKVHHLPARSPDLNQVVWSAYHLLLVQEAEDPQSTHVLQHLMSNLNGASLYRIDVPEHARRSIPFFDLLVDFRQKHRATIIALKKGSQIISDPDNEETVRAGDALFYVRANRLAAEDIVWQ